jgi:citrate lyase subunit beta/citryl-CoA lyase
MYRSMLYVPGHVDRFIAKVHERGADAIILDLEDAVPEAGKAAAASALAANVPRVRQAGAAVFVRINSGMRAKTDAQAAAAAGATGIVVAKADPSFLETLAPLGVPMLALLEHPAAILDARACAAMPAVIGIMVGGEDLATALNAQATPEVLRIPKLLAHYAAKAEGKLSFGMLRTISDYSDLDAIRLAATEARAHGFDGASCVHPSIVPILNASFAPSPAELAWARTVADAARYADGAFALDGKMVDRPIVERAHAILRQAR